MNNKKQKHNLQYVFKAIEIIGGVRQLAISIGTSYQSVLDWKNNRKSPSPINCQKIEKATGGKVKARDILPDFPWDDLK